MCAVCVGVGWGRVGAVMTVMTVMSVMSVMTVIAPGMVFTCSHAVVRFPVEGPGPRPVDRVI